MITWEPWLNNFNPQLFPFVKKVTNINERGLTAIVEGKFDAYINEWTLNVRKFRHPLFLRFGHEMNNPYRYPLGPQNNAPEDFIKAIQAAVKNWSSF